MFPNHFSSGMVSCSLNLSMDSKVDECPNLNQTVHSTTTQVQKYSQKPMYRLIELVKVHTLPGPRLGKLKHFNRPTGPLAISKVVANEVATPNLKVYALLLLLRHLLVVLMSTLLKPPIGAFKCNN